MRNVLAITVALTVAAIILMPALGYTNQAAGNQSYTVKSGEKVAYSFTTNVPAHNLTSDMVANKYSFESSGVKSTRMPYSFQQSGIQPYSVKIEGAENAVAQGEKAKKEVAMLGSMNKQEPAAAAVEPAPAQTEEPAPVANATETAPVVAAPKFTIEGMVFNDTNGNFTQDADEAGLAGWTVNLEQAGAAVKTATTADDGKFSFADVDVGEYTVSEVLAEGWSIIAPAEGKLTVAVVDANVAGLAFANQLMPVAAAPAVAENATAVVDVPTNATA